MNTDARDYAITLAYRAGTIIKAGHGMGMSKEWKGDDTPLTVTDRQINQLVLDELAKKYPDHSVISEEGSKVKESEYTWVCDPIDGTVPFSHGFPISVFALALTRNGESILGVIYDPYMDRMVVAEKGKGTHVNGKKARVSKKNEFKNAVIDLEMWIGSYLAVNTLHTTLIKQYCHTTSIRSTSYGAMLVACGEFAAVIGSSENPWDGAAAKIIVEEAGGRVTDLYGADQRYNQKIKGILASNGFLHNTLLKLVKLHLK